MHSRHYFLFLESLHFLSQFQQQQERRGQNMNYTKYVSHTNFLLQVTSIFHFSLWWHLMLSLGPWKRRRRQEKPFSSWTLTVASSQAITQRMQLMPNHLSLYIMFVHAFLVTLPCLKNIIQGLEMHLLRPSPLWCSLNETWFLHKICHTAKMHFSALRQQLFYTYFSSRQWMKSRRVCLDLVALLNWLFFFWCYVNWVGGGTPCKGRSKMFEASPKLPTRFW